MRTHNQTEVSRVKRCHMDYDQEDGCPMCIAERRALDLAERLAAAEERARRLEEALRLINEDACNRIDASEHLRECKAEFPGHPEMWCAPCVAAFALAPPPEAEKKGGEK